MADDKLSKTTRQSKPAPTKVREPKKKIQGAASKTASPSGKIVPPFGKTITMQLRGYDHVKDASFAEGKVIERRRPHPQAEANTFWDQLSDDKFEEEALLGVISGVVAASALAHDQIVKNQKEIEQLKTETRTILATLPGASTQ
jgi:hypothetical protein